jgi:hypothetical protein
MKEYEITYGGIETPEQGTINMPPKYCGRKDIKQGEIVIVTNPTPFWIAKKLIEVRNNGETEIVAVNKKATTAREDDDR